MEKLEIIKNIAERSGGDLQPALDAHKTETQVGVYVRKREAVPLFFIIYKTKYVPKG